MRLAVCGASGTVGSALVPQLVDAGHQVLLVGRNVGQLRARYPSFECADYTELPDALRGCDAVLNLAVRNNDRRSDTHGYRQANVQLVKSLYRSAATAGVGRFAQFSTVRAVRPGRSDGYGQSKREADEWLKRQSAVPVDIIRLAALRDAGPVGSGTARLARALLPAGLIGALRPEVSARTVARAVLRLLAHPSAEAARVTLVTDSKQDDPWYHAVKRASDVAFALGVTLLLWWLMALLWLAIRLSSPGPGIFAQTRVGKDRRPFRCYKFRTMHVGTREAGSHEVSAAQVTALGRFLRRFKLDELPQVVNLLRGQMSLVGPRPCLPSQAELIREREERGVYVADPGITGWAQVHDIDMSDPVRLAETDAEYLACRSLLLDLRIVLQTMVGRGLGDRTAPGDQRPSMPA